MGFVEYKNLDLVELNNSVLEKWKEENCFENTLKSREGAKSSYFSKAHLLQTGCPVFTMLWPEPLKTPFAATKLRWDIT